MAQIVIVIFAGLILNGCSIPGSVSVQTDYHVIPFRTIGQRIPLISGILNDKRAWFIIDTGASITLLNAAEAGYYGFSMHESHNDLTEVRGFSSQLQLSKTSFCNIEIGQLKIGRSVYRSQEMNQLFRIIENEEKLRIAGVLGSDILARYRMNVNYESKTLSFRMK